MPSDYHTHRERERNRRRQATLAKQEIGDIPEIVDPHRRGEAGESFERFCRSYFPNIFTLPWATYHHDLIGAVENAVHQGEWSCMAVPRGGGKTSLMEAGILWAALYSYARFSSLICSSDARAIERLNNIKVELRTNDLLLADFPEVCFPIACLGRSARRCEGQKCNGVHTAIQWGQSEIAFPTIEDSMASGKHHRSVRINRIAPRLVRHDGTRRPPTSVVDLSR